MIASRLEGWTTRPWRSYVLACPPLSSIGGQDTPEVPSHITVGRGPLQGGGCGCPPKPGKRATRCRSLSRCRLDRPGAVGVTRPLALRPPCAAGVGAPSAGDCIHPDAAIRSECDLLLIQQVVARCLYNAQDIAIAALGGGLPHSGQERSSRQQEVQAAPAPTRPASRDRIRGRCFLPVEPACKGPLSCVRRTPALNASTFGTGPIASTPRFEAVPRLAARMPPESAGYLSRDVARAPT